MPQDNKQSTSTRTISDQIESSIKTDIDKKPITPLARRKTVDRRESDPTTSQPENDRRSSESRRISNKAKTEKPAKTDKEKALDRIREQNEQRVQQHRKKKLLAGCEPVMGMNYDCLAMDDYPDNALVAAAKRDRDYWIALCSVFASVFFFGLIGLVPAWISGAACGLSVLSFLFAFTPARKSFFSRPPLGELLAKRKMIEFRALNHIQFLEGKDGLAWRCSKMSKYNTNLDRKLFNGVIRFSRERSILGVVKSKKHIRLYLLFMIESQKAYKRLQKDYLERHFKHMDQGWDDSISDADEGRLTAELDLPTEGIE